MKALALLTSLAILLLAGCAQFEPINTQLEMDGIIYKSEKDIIYEKTVLPDGTEEVKFQALASAPAYAQAEREKMQAEISRNQSETALEALQLTSQIIPAAIGAYKGVPVSTPTVNPPTEPD